MTKPNPAPVVDVGEFEKIVDAFGDRSRKTCPHSYDCNCDDILEWDRQNVIAAYRSLKAEYESIGADYSNLNEMLRSQLTAANAEISRLKTAPSDAEWNECFVRYERALHRWDEPGIFDELAAASELTTARENFDELRARYVNALAEQEKDTESLKEDRNYWRDLAYRAGAVDALFPSSQPKGVTG